MAIGKELQLNKLSVGTKVSLITSAQYRYEGKVAAINSVEGTLMLQKVSFWGPENRLPADNSTRGPAIGSVFDSITFWMSSVIHLQTHSEDVEGFGDKAVVKASSTSSGSNVPTNGDNVQAGNCTGSRQRSKIQRQKWPKKSDLQAQHSPGEHLSHNQQQQHGMNQTTTSGRSSGGPRTIVSYVRRSGRFPNGGYPLLTGSAMSHKQYHSQRGDGGISVNGNGGCMTMMPHQLGTGGAMLNRRGPLQPAFYRYDSGPMIMQNGTNANLLRRGSALSGQRMNESDVSKRRFSNGCNDNGNAPGSGNGGGVFVYLPPEMAAAYHHQQHQQHQQQQRGMMLRRRPIPSGGGGGGNGRRSSGGRRRPVRRGSILGYGRQVRGLSEPDIDCSTPYDFESANAQLEAELAKLTLSDEDSLSATSADGDTVANANGANGDGDAAAASSTSTTTGGVGVSASTANGASGDSSSGAVTSTAGAGGAGGTGIGTGTAVNREITASLAKGEYYDREKSFFDRISRSEIGSHVTGGFRTLASSGVKTAVSGIGSTTGNNNAGIGGGSSGAGNSNGSGSGNVSSATGVTATTGSTTTTTTSTTITPANTTQTAGLTNGKQRSRFGSSGGSNSLLPSARRERKLNLETFGSLAARPVLFAPRFRHNSHYRRVGSSSGLSFSMPGSRNPGPAVALA